MMETTP